MQDLNNDDIKDVIKSIGMIVQCGEYEVASKVIKALGLIDDEPIGKTYRPDLKRAWYALKVKRDLRFQISKAIKNDEFLNDKMEKIFYSDTPDAGYILIYGPMSDEVAEQLLSIDGVDGFEFEGRPLDVSELSFLMQQPNMIPYAKKKNIN